DEKRENEIVDGEIGFADEVAQRGRAPQAPRTMNQFSHATRVRAAARRGKTAVGSTEHGARSKEQGARRWEMEDRRECRYSAWDGAGGELSLNRRQQLVHQARVCDTAKNLEAGTNRNAKVYARGVK